MKVKDFLAPTRGRTLLFIIIFVLVFVYDTAFAPFPGSPVVDNLDTQQGAMSFVIYILLLPYILSCLIPAFAGMRKKKIIRMLNLRHFFYPRPVLEEQKPSRQEHFIFPAGTPVVESKLVLQAPAEASPSQAQSGKKASPGKAKPASKPKPVKKSKPAKPRKKR